ncbi:gluconokinase, GntK/IdnK-type [Streptomyces sp. NPDC005349]|uniref:gluconokinase, GntK/IdnK-type n=1 Tax=Streptomyces sp. NPDC005349 TaxID=3157037 RepID=UPI0033A26B9F
MAVCCWTSSTATPSLSIRSDEAEEAWRVVEPVLSAWERGLVPLEEYPAGSDGPPPRHITPVRRDDLRHEDAVMPTETNPGQPCRTGHRAHRTEGEPMARPAESRPPCVVITGVSGAGKSTVARQLAERLGVPFAEADDFHSSDSVRKMASGVPLDDRDRRSWLESVGRWLRDRYDNASGGVVACSALRRRYRDILRSACPAVLFLQLSADREVLAKRLHGRTGHFMPETLLDSQLATLEPLEPDERGACLDAALAPEEIVRTAMKLLPEL